MKSVCVLGGYGIFGSRITKALVRYSIPTIIAGRNKNNGLKLQKEIKQQYPDANIQVAAFDAKKEIKQHLEKLQPLLIINTCGPFQNSDYSIARACISLGIHYIDLADGRDFVNHIDVLDQEAKQNNVMVITGASTVPGLSSAVIEHFKSEFKTIDKLDFGITPGAKTPRGTATAKSILSYIGKPLKSFPGGKRVFGWQDLHKVTYPDLGNRWMGNCDVPDLDLLPKKYNIKQLRFSAGMESGMLHLSIWLLSWLVRMGLPLNLMNYASMLTKLSHIFDVFGSSDGGMHVILKGVDHNNKPLTIKWFVIVKQGDGPQVPAVPAIILARKIITNELNEPGAKPCVGMVSLEDYMHELSHYASRDYVFKSIVQ